MRGSFDTKSNKGDKGLIPLSIQEIFRVIKSEEKVKQYKISVSYMEVSIFNSYLTT